VLDWTGQRVGADVRLFEGGEGEIRFVEGGMASDLHSLFTGLCLS
jgi:hypothetical protein